MGIGNSSERGSSPGLNQYCYQTGYDHAKYNDPDPVGEGIAAAACTLNREANKNYGKGITDGRRDTYHSRPRS